MTDFRSAVDTVRGQLEVPSTCRTTELTWEIYQQTGLPQRESHLNHNCIVAVTTASLFGAVPLAALVWLAPVVGASPCPKHMYLDPYVNMCRLDCSLIRGNPPNDDRVCLWTRPGEDLDKDFLP